MPAHLERIRAEVVGIVAKDPLGNLQADRCSALVLPYAQLSLAGVAHLGPKQAIVDAIFGISFLPFSSSLSF